MLNVDREKAEAMGVSFDEINQTISVATGSSYVNDYTNNGRVQQVIVQADAPYRMQPEQLLTLSVKNRSGRMLPLAAFVTLSGTLPRSSSIAIRDIRPSALAEAPPRASPRVAQ